MNAINAKREKAMQDLRQAICQRKAYGRQGGELMSKNPADLSLDDRLKVRRISRR